MASNNELIKCVRKYRNIDNSLKELNLRTQAAREERKLIELEMSDILKSSSYATIHKLEIKDDNSYIKIQRPGMWTKPWGLSIKELKNNLDAFWASPLPKTPDECLKFITDNRKSQLVATEFSFTRNSLSHVENEA
jgi:hypothetical protein